ncbi:hypothetical protein XH92_36210 [Bradyrhizobium sp. CCBAU 53421]|nr:hypothetical protein XH92_36210 [Bradyrhizobium sp. CCBAU 53421]
MSELVVAFTHGDRRRVLTRGPHHFEKCAFDAFEAALQARGFGIRRIRPPTVPAGTARGGRCAEVDRRGVRENESPARHACWRPAQPDALSQGGLVCARINRGLVSSATASYASGVAFNYPQMLDSIAVALIENLESDESLVIHC